MMTKIITTEGLQALLNRENIKIIDIRPVEAYNGWRLANEVRGGHIPGAKSLPNKWLKYVDWIEMVKHKGIRPDHRIVIYGYTVNEMEQAALRFINSGFLDIEIYPYFLTEWVTRHNLPLNRLHHYKLLVSARWVHDLVNKNEVLEFKNNKFVIVHAHYRNRDAYLSGHIPGAIDMDTLALEAPETWNRRTPHELKETLEKHGITAETTVVLYGKYMDPDNNDPFPGSAAGDIGAIRCAFIMMYAGVKDVRIMNGGFQSWVDEGFGISYTDQTKQPVSDFGVSIPAHPELAVDTPEAKKMIEANDAELVCVRSWDEYIGKVSGYNYIEAKGRIPGAIFADCGSDAYHMENYRNFDHTTREYQEVAEIWQKNGITPDKHLAFYCGTGWRGSEAWFNAWLMGWPNVSVYDGGWFEWSADPSNPFENGIPEFYASETL